MANKMLIDAAHPEETRVVVLRGNRIEEFDFESASKRQLRGNIYLAKVTRVEPSLQAAFIEYGGNRHGFLAFSEIHPDYYQIPVADRQALLEDEARSHAEEEEEAPPRTPNGNGGGRRSRRFRRGSRGGGERPPGQGEPHEAGSDENGGNAASDEVTDPETGGQAILEGGPERGDDAPDLGFGDDDPAQDSGDQATAAPVEVGDDDPAPEAEPGDAMPLRAAVLDDVVSEPSADAETQGIADRSAEMLDADEVGNGGDEVTTLDHGYEAAPAEGDPTDDVHEGEAGGHPEGDDEPVEQLGGRDALEEVPNRVTRPRRHYKIQEVIKRRQILLVQVVKEERGNKGAALTTYLSLAGRYSVLMPNTARGGGISRKITDSEDRKRLKAIAQELEVPEGMGIILRTAGAARGIAEVKRDFEYLLRMWETVRETTLQSSAPMLVYEEGSLIKRAIRDLYGKEIDEVLVAGEDSFKEARDFMRLLMPSHARNVVPYRDPQPIFAKNGVEAQLDAMFSNHVTLRSGGYIVINQTEALVAIDVNSGRSTREHNIEDTALRTNLEAADEVARQLRLRDLAGLIVVDFIDMEEGRNDRAVEKRIKDALKDDRARIQIGRISHFGLLEMSRQRIRTGVLEGSTVLCSHCGGAGTVRSVSSIALHVLRLVEDALIKSAAHNVTVRTRAEVALYILNQKRTSLLDLEMRFGVSVSILSDPLMTGTVYHAIERGAEATPPVMLGLKPKEQSADPAEPIDEDDVEDGAEDEIGDDAGEDEARPVQSREGQGAQRGDGEDGQRRRKRRRRRRGGRGEAEGRLPAEGVPTSETAFEEGVEPVRDATGEEVDLDGRNEVVALDVAAVDVTTIPVPDDVTLAENRAEGGLPRIPDEPGPAADDVVGDGTPRRRRTRRPRADAAPEEGAATPARRPRRSRAKAAGPVEPDEDQTRPSADMDIEADTAKTHPADASPEPVLADVFPSATAASSDGASGQAPVPTGAGASPVEPEGKTAPVEPSDPPQPKRSGWWQRAKATFTPGS